MRRKSPLVVMALNRASSKKGLEGRTSTQRPGALLQQVGRPAPTVLRRLLDVRPGKRPHYWRSLHTPISALARGTQTRDVQAVFNEIKAFVARREHRSCGASHVVGHSATQSHQSPLVLGNGGNCRFGVGLGDCEVLTEDYSKCLLKCGRLRMFKGKVSLPSRIPCTKTFNCAYISIRYVMMNDARCRAICT